MRKILNKIESPKDLKSLSHQELKEIAAEIRDEMIRVVSVNGGHLAPSLGVVELTIGIHLALESPKDSIIFDVGHQAYVHKILTGRLKKFSTLRRHGGLSGFPKRAESEHDIFDTGHASNSISVALGIAEAKRMKGEAGTTLAVIGDGSLTGGMAYEGLNQAGHLKTPMIVILNDNGMSIARNVGAFSSYLARIRFDPTLYKIREEMEHKVIKMIKTIPGVGSKISSIAEGLKESLKHILVPGMIFEELGWKYIGPIDGHDAELVASTIRIAKEIGAPVVIHCLTKKGKGYPFAENHPERFHGTGPFEIDTGEVIKSAKKTYTEVFGEALLEIAESDERLVAITAAMPAGTGLDVFAKRFPARFYDVGIAEQHAVTFASGLALEGYLPVVAIYSTFLQRSFDQIIQDVALQNLHVIFAIDRAGLVGEDGPTHHGVFDLSYLRQIPNMTIMSPKDEFELKDMIHFSTELSGAVAIRYPRGSSSGVKIKSASSKLRLGKAEVLRTGSGVAIIAVGRMVQPSLAAAKLLAAAGIDASVVNARFVKPLDEELYARLAKEHDLIVTVEENSIVGGFGSGVLEFFSERSIETPFLKIALPDEFVEHGAVSILHAVVGLDCNGVTERISEKCEAMGIGAKSKARQFTRKTGQI
ncbi:MAG: 1-deoxy-D-xylulose-5-phosphate synthase [Actinomycetota bacterium]|nr:1-deoxy-D-xylulose-5-phosphate synthase [Actinomycetota bacterium]